MRPTVVPVLAPTSTELSRLVDDFLSSKRAAGLSSKSIEQYRYALQEVFLPFARKEGITEPGGLTSRALDRLSTHLLEQGTEGLTTRPRGALSKATVHSYLRPVRWFSNWVNSDDGVGAGTVGGKVQLPKLKSRQHDVDVLDENELKAMSKVAGDRGLRDQLIVEVLKTTGMRSGELAGLRPSSLLRKDGRYFLRVHGKGDKDRNVPVSPGLFKDLEKWADRMKRQVQDPDRVWIFMSARRSRVTGDLEPLTPSGVLQIVKSIAESAGIRKRVYTHLVRHSFSTDFLKKKGSPLALKDILGHADLTMIQRHYGHLTDNDTYDAMLEYLKR